jgi:hypothetical protein
MAGYAVLDALLAPAEVAALRGAVDSVRAAAEFGAHQTVFRVSNPDLSVRVRQRLADAAEAADAADAAGALLPPGFAVCDEWFYTIYPPGGGMGAHMDGARRDRDDSGGARRSVATLLVYLTDDFQDGCTCVLDRYPATDADAASATLAEVRPQAGRALLLRQDVWHMARPAVGGAKVLARSDVMVL